MNQNDAPDYIFHNGRITTLDPKCPEARNVAIQGGRIVGVDDAENYERGPNTKVIDLMGRRVSGWTFRETGASQKGRSDCSFREPGR